jgi:cytochrome c553
MTAVLGKSLASYIAVTLVVAVTANDARAQRRTPPIVTVCAPCHGTDGTGGDIEKPNLAGQNSIYLRKQLLAFRSGTRRHPDMNKRAQDLTDREIDQLVIYYSTLIAR